MKYRKFCIIRLQRLQGLENLSFNQVFNYHVFLIAREHWTRRAWKPSCVWSFPFKSQPTKPDFLRPDQKHFKFEKNRPKLVPSLWLDIQNLKKRTRLNWEFYNEIAELRNCAKLELRKSGIGKFCAKWLLRMIAQIAVFSRKTDAQRKKNFAFCSAKIAQKFCEWKP